MEDILKTVGGTYLWVAAIMFGIVALWALIKKLFKIGVIILIIALFFSFTGIKAEQIKDKAIKTIDGVKSGDNFKLKY